VLKVLSRIFHTAVMGRNLDFEITKVRTQNFGKRFAHPFCIRGNPSNDIRALLADKR
jgi:hypothetical protein